MKKVVLILFVVFSLFSSANIKMPSNTVHTHVHINEMGIEHVHEHSHVEVSNTLYFNSYDSKEYLNLKISKLDNKNTLNPKHIINSIFRPPINV